MSDLWKIRHFRPIDKKYCKFL